MLNALWRGGAYLHRVALQRAGTLPQGGIAMKDHQINWEVILGSGVIVGILVAWLLLGWAVL